jgi:hypothetical protein
VGSPHGGEGAQATRSLDVADKANDDHGGRLEDGDSLNSLLLVQLCKKRQREETSVSSAIMNSLIHNMLRTGTGSNVEARVSKLTGAWSVNLADNVGLKKAKANKDAGSCAYGRWR